MAQKKSYELMETTVAPSKVQSIEKNTVVAGRYRIRECLGLRGNAVHYGSDSTVITFITKNAEGKAVPGIQPEQLAIVMRDFLLSQENPNQVQINALNTFLGISD